MKNIFYILFFTFSTLTYGQTFTKLSIKVGPNISGLMNTPPIIDTGAIYNDGHIKFGISMTIEPTILTFGNKKQFDFSADISFIQKGGKNYGPVIKYDNMGQPASIWTEEFPVTINYFSISPTIKFNFWKIMTAKVGPRLDFFTNFASKTKYLSDTRSNKDFEPLTYGITYGVGICTGKNKIKFICEFIGQNDFSNSSFNKASGQTFKNFCYILNLGVTIALNKQNE